MEKVELFCDVCGVELTTFKVTDDGEELQIHSVYTTKNADTKKIFPHLCERCASKLDYLFEKLKEQENERINMISRRWEINKRRKKIFNTKG